MERDEIIGLVESAVAEHFGIKQETIRSGGKSRAVSDSRLFLWYFLHYRWNMTSLEIAKEYGKSKRNIYYAVSFVREGIKAPAVLSEEPLAD